MRWDVCQGLLRVLEKGGAGNTTTTTQNFSPEEAAQRARVQEEAARIYGQTAQSISTSQYPGPQPQQPSAWTVAGQNTLAQQGGVAQGQANQATNYSSWLMGPAQYAEANPYLQSAIGAATRPITQAYSGAGGALSQIRSGSVGAGQYGSSRQGIAEGLAAQGYEQAVADTAARMSNANYMAAQEAGQRALALTPQTMQAGLMPAQIYSAIGQQQEAYGANAEDYAAAQRGWEMNAPWAALQNYANIVFGGSAPGSTTTGDVAGPNRALTALSGAAAGGMLGSMAAGASAGSIAPGWGTAIGAGIGLLAGLFS